MSEFKSWNSYRQFSNHVRQRTRFIRTREDEDFLREVLRTSESRIRDMPADFGLWRAQLGHAWRLLDEENPDVGEIPAAYPRKRMKPIASRVTEGRVNPKGIPVLYLSTQRDTALSEVRPGLGSLLSCAYFKTKRALRIVDFSVHQDSGISFFFSEPSAIEREQAVWTQIDHAFSEPTTSRDNSTDYVPTQVIAELFKSEGFDGIAYKSAFGDDGYNIALFDIADAELTYCNLCKVTAAEYSFKEEDNPYWVDPDGKTKTIAVKIVGPAASDDSGQ